MSRFNFAFCVLLIVSATCQRVQADPTAPEYLEAAPHSADALSDQSTATQLPVLNFIQIGQQKSAVINGQRVKVGDKVGQYVVQQIDARQVVLQQNEQRLVLKLFQTMKK